MTRLILGDGRIKLRQGDCLEVMKKIPDNSIDMILCDPPYVKMVADKWDRLSDEHYEKFFSALKEEAYRVLRPGGRFVSFSSNDTLRYLYGGKLQHRELIVIDKDYKKVSAGRNTKRYKQHINATEYVFVATKFARSHVKRLLIKAQGNKTSKQINTLLGNASNGGGMWSIYTGNNVCQQVPTEDQWTKFRKIFRSLPSYSEFEEVFNNEIGKGNILGGFNFRMKPRLHTAQKPVALLEYLIKTYTDKGDTVLDNTMGSGSTGVACMNLKRRFIGIEKEKNYFDTACKRIEDAYDNRNKKTVK